MKKMLFVSVCFFSVKSIGQEQPDLKKLGRPFKLEKRSILPIDSSLIRHENAIPNAMKVKESGAQLIGNNGKGQNIYALPLDKMPCIKPDSTYQSKMPNAVMLYRSNKSRN